MSVYSIVQTLQDLPAPPSGKTGWPWTESSQQLSPTMPNGKPWPKISVITPSYNQGEFIEETIRSVLLQGYPNLEFIIIDGGSTDNSLEIIKKYQSFISYWVSEPDKGQSDALNKGFRRATGELIGWQNSDDYYHPNNFRYAAQTLMKYPNSEIIYGAVDHVDSVGNFIRTYPVSDFDLCQLIPYLNMCNQSMFFTKRVFERGNYIDLNFHHTMDLEFLVRLAIQKYKFYFVPEMRGYYRVHEQTKSSLQYDICIKDCLKVYKYIYLNTKLPNDFREKALRCIYGITLDSFAKQHFSTFRQSVRDSIKIAGFRSLDWKILIKYLLSFLGTNIKYIKKIKSLFESSGAITQ